jgi:membrane carboxypeptidase/penicillin-binding protein PbpC
MAKLYAGNFPKSYRPTLISPKDGEVYASFSGKDPSIPLKAEGTEGELFWYLDGEYFTSKEGSIPFATLPPGEHRVSLIDGRSLSASATFTVERREAGAPLRSAPVLRFD